MRALQKLLGSIGQDIKDVKHRSSLLTKEANDIRQATLQESVNSSTTENEVGRDLRVTVETFDVRLKRFLVVRSFSFSRLKSWSRRCQKICGRCGLLTPTSRNQTKNCQKSMCLRKFN